MSRLPSLSTISIGAAAGAAAVFGGWLQLRLRDEGLTDAAGGAVALSLAAMLAVALRYAIREWIVGNRHVRRLLLGSQYVEGTWVDTVRLEDGTEQLGITHVGPDGDGLRFTGRNFDTDGNHVGSFRSTAAELRDHELHYLCETREDGPPSVFGRSAGILTFTLQEGRPREYEGVFLAYEGELASGRIRGVKPGKKDRKDLRDPGKQKAALCRLAEPLRSPDTDAP